MPQGPEDATGELPAITRCSRGGVLSGHTTTNHRQIVSSHKRTVPYVRPASQHIKYTCADTKRAAAQSTVGAAAGDAQELVEQQRRHTDRHQRLLSTTCCRNHSEHWLYSCRHMCRRSRQIRCHRSCNKRYRHHTLPTCSQGSSRYCRSDSAVTRCSCRKFRTAVAAAAPAAAAKTSSTRATTAPCRQHLQRYTRARYYIPSGGSS